MRRALLTATLCAGVAAPAQADDALDQAKARYAAGVEAFKAKRYAEAIQSLEAAYALKPIPKFLVDIARTHLKTGDKTAALTALRKFLREARLGDPDRPAAEEMVKQLEAEVGPESPAIEEVPAPIEVPGVEAETEAAPTKPGDKASPGRGRQAGPASLIHTPVDEARVGVGVPIVAELPPGVDATQVLLRYRDGGDVRFREVRLDAQGYALVGEIPAARVTASSIHYYLEARDAAGRTIAMSGNPYNPHIIVVAGGKARPVRVVHRGERAPPPRYRGWTWAAGIAAGVLVAGGTTLAILARDREAVVEARAQSSLEAQPPFRWDEEGTRDLAEQGESFATWARVVLVAGGLAAAGAGTLWYVDYRRSHAPPKAVMPMTRLGVTPLGLWGEFE